MFTAVLGRCNWVALWWTWWLYFLCFQNLHSPYCLNKAVAHSISVLCQDEGSQRSGNAAWDGPLSIYNPRKGYSLTLTLTLTLILDLTIFKGDRFNRQLLDIRTYQKPQKYQYLHFSSNHPLSVFKGIIVGECTRYIRTNSSYDTFAQVQLFKQRLSSRQYPPSFVHRCCNLVSYSKRTHYLTSPKSHTNTVRHRPFFRCIPPPHFALLKSIILTEFHSIQHLVSRPLFVTLKHKTLTQHLVRAQLIPTQNQLFDIIVSLPYPTDNQHKTTGHPLYTMD